MADPASAAPAAPVEKFRKDYQPHPFAMDGIELDFDLRDEVSTVTTTIQLRRTGAADAALELDGEDLETVSIAIDGRELAVGEQEGVGAVDDAIHDRSFLVRPHRAPRTQP